MNDTRIYVGNLSYTTNESGLRDFFAECGNIEDLVIIMDRATNRSKGFGFVTFDCKEAATSAVEQKNGTELDGRTLRINIADSERKAGGGGSGRRDRGDRGGSQRGGYRDRNR